MGKAEAVRVPDDFAGAEGHRAGEALGAGDGLPAAIDEAEIALRQIEHGDVRLGADRERAQLRVADLLRRSDGRAR